MIRIGEYNKLRVVKEVDFGLYLDGANYGEILLPKRYVPQAVQIDDVLEVFIYLDSEDRLIATTEKPYAQVGEFAFLQCKDVNDAGAFMEWGLTKDLLVPFSQQRMKLELGRWYVIYVMLDSKTERIIGSNKIDKFLHSTQQEGEEPLQPGQLVDLLIYEKTDMGYKAIINQSLIGVLFHPDVFTRIDIGMKGPGFIKQIRPDGKIDLVLQPIGHEKVDLVAEMLLKRLKASAGFLPFNDKSDAELIYKEFGISKKTFKKSIGDLYKKRLIRLEESGIRSTENGVDIP